NSSFRNQRSFVNPLQKSNLSNTHPSANRNQPSSSNKTEQQNRYLQKSSTTSSKFNSNYPFGPCKVCGLTNHRSIAWFYRKQLDGLIAAVVMPSVIGNTHHIFISWPVDH
ncbi:unnamed protein product, partial [Didymodactylos carnosus]